MTQTPTQLVEEMVRQHQAALRAFIYSRTNSRTMAEDLAQEVFLVAFQNIEAFDSSRSAWPWLLGIAKNKLRRYWAENGWRAEAHSIEECLLESEFACQLQEPDGDEQERYLEALQECVNTLPERSRMLLEKVYEKRLTCEFIANQLNKQAGAIRIMLYRLRVALMGCVEERLMAEECNP